MYSGGLSPARGPAASCTPAPTIAQARQLIEMVMDGVLPAEVKDEMIANAGLPVCSTASGRPGIEAKQRVGDGPVEQHQLAGPPAAADGGRHRASR